MKKTFIIGEVGINHNGDIGIAKKLIDVAVVSGMDAVKFQKRTVDRVYSPEYLNEYKESPWGITQREEKEELELSIKEYREINKYCKERKIEWMFSAWDAESQIIMRDFGLNYNKISSVMLTNYELLELIAEERKYTYISTGMSTMEEIRQAVEVFRKHDCPFELMHCNSKYPMEDENVNLLMIQTLKEEFGDNVGFSGYERGMTCTLAAVAMGARSIKRYITLDRTMYGPYHKVSMEPNEVFEMVREIRKIERAFGNGKNTVSHKREK